MFGLSYGEGIMTLAFFRLDTVPECDRRTDRQTDGHSSSGYTSACIVCYANALVKIVGVQLSFLSLQTSNYSGQRHQGERNGDGVSPSPADLSGLGTGERRNLSQRSPGRFMCNFMRFHASLYSLSAARQRLNMLLLVLGVDVYCVSCQCRLAT